MRRKILVLLKVLTVAVILLVATAVVVLQVPLFQTFMVEKLTASLNSSLGGRVKVGKTYLRFFNTLMLTDVSVADDAPASPSVPDTLFRADKVMVSFSLGSLLSPRGPEVSRVKIAGGEMNLVIEDPSDGYGNNLSRIFRLLPDSTAKAPKEGKLFEIKRVQLLDFGFNMYNLTADAQAQAELGGINWYDMSVSDINFDIAGLKMVSGIMYGKMVDGSFREKSGFDCRHISGTVRAGGGLTSISELRITDEFSDIYIDNYSMMYDSTESFSDYVNKVRMSMDIKQPCVVDLRTIGFFAPQLAGLDVPVSLQGQVTGTVASLYTEGLRAGLPKEGTSFELKGGIDGLPDIRTAVMDAYISGLELSVPVIERTVRDFAGTDVGDALAAVSDGVRFSLTAHFSGTLRRLFAGGRLVSPQAGVLRFRLGASGLVSGRGIGVEGEISTRALDLGKVLDNGMLGPLTMGASLRARIGKEARESSLDIDSLSIGQLRFNGYDYSDIKAVGLLENGSFDGRIVSNDPNLNLMFQGIVSLVPKADTSVYRFFANVGYADLNALNFDPRWKAVTSLRAGANFTKTALGEMQGYIKVSDMMLEYGGRKERIGDIVLESSSDPDKYELTLASDFLNAEYYGEAPVTQFAQDVLGLSAGRALPALELAGKGTKPGKRYGFSLTTGDTRALASYLMPGLYIADRTVLTAAVDRDGAVDAALVSGRLAMGESYIRNLIVDVASQDSTADVSVRGSEARLASFMLGSPQLSVRAMHDRLSAGLSYSDGGGRLLNGGSLSLDAFLSRVAPDGSLATDIMFRDSEFVIDGYGWKLSPSKVRVSAAGIEADSVMIRTGKQAILLNSPSADTLNVSLRDFDITPVNAFLGEGYDLKGRFSGDISLLDVFGQMGLLMDISGDSVSVAGADVGSLTLMSKWDQPNKRFNLFVKNSLGGASTFNVTGFYRTADKVLSANARLSGLDAAYFRPVLSSFLSDVSGSVSGELSLYGPAERMALRSTGLTAENLRMVIDYTKVPYVLNGKIEVDETGVRFDNMDVRDRFGNAGRLSGGINYDYFKDISFDTRLTFARMECLNISEKEADAFYGSAFATGRFELKGPLDALEMYAEASTYDRTSFHVPLGSASQAGTSNLLTFTDYSEPVAVDPYEEMIAGLKEQDRKSTSLLINMHLNVTPSAGLYVEIDKTSGNVLSGRGTGVLDLTIEPNKDIFDIRGDYTIDSGNYRFVALNIASRDFTIDSGSKIQFRGDIMDSDLDIKAIYTTKASVGTLIADTSSVSSRRTVNCGLGISGKILNPVLSFSIDIPDLDPMVRSRVENALSTQDKVQKQFLSLIISNSFLPDEQSSIVNNSSMFLSNVTEIMSGQLNSILEKLDIPLDLGVNYQQTDKGNDIFDVAVSTQLFNNRVIVNGNIGNRQYNTSSSGDVVGDVDIEVKLDKRGALRLKIFSHSADQYTSYLDQSQRNGVGVSYQQEFSTFKELWRNLFWSRKRKQQAEEAILNKVLESDMKEEDVVITIEK